MGSEGFLDCEVCCAWLPLPVLLGSSLSHLSVGEASFSPNRRGEWFLGPLIVSGAPDGCLLSVLLGLPDVRGGPIVSGGGRGLPRGLLLLGCRSKRAGFG